jgi:hypothetical protein
MGFIKMKLVYIVLNIWESQKHSHETPNTGLSLHAAEPRELIHLLQTSYRGSHVIILLDKCQSSVVGMHQWRLYPLFLPSWYAYIIDSYYNM